MKILFVNMFYNEEGGAQKSTKFLAEQLVKEGHEVFAYSDDAIDSDIEEVINGVKVFRRRTPLFSLHYIFSAIKYLRPIIYLQKENLSISLRKYNQILFTLIQFQECLYQ